ncbi:uncharacterized protein [Amphiura filiformis]|uniref:uncharacterized protein n=1 Tax=Amphiura filiformis TaxID=82378 RepID=UPI003B221DA2
MKNKQVDKHRENMKDNKMDNLLAPFLAFIVLEFGFAMAVNALYDEDGGEDHNTTQQVAPVGTINSDISTYYYVFAIWGIIYALQVCWIGYTLYGVSKKYKFGSAYVHPPLFCTS